MLNAYYNKKIVIKREDTPAEWMEPGETEEYELMVRIDDVNEWVRNELGEQVKSSKVMRMPYDKTVFYTDRVQVDGVDHAILKIEEKQDFSPDHYRVWLS